MLLTWTARTTRFHLYKIMWRLIIFCNFCWDPSLLLIVLVSWWYWIISDLSYLLLNLRNQLVSLASRLALLSIPHVFSFLLQRLDWKEFIRFDNFKTSTYYKFLHVCAKSTELAILVTPFIVMLIFIDYVQCDVKIFKLWNCFSNCLLRSKYLLRGWMQLARLCNYTFI